MARLDLGGRHLKGTCTRRAFMSVDAECWAMGAPGQASTENLGVIIQFLTVVRWATCLLISTCTIISFFRSFCFITLLPVLSILVGFFFQVSEKLILF